MATSLLIWILLFVNCVKCSLVDYKCALVRGTVKALSAIVNDSRDHFIEGIGLSENHPLITALINSKDVKSLSNLEECFGEDYKIVQIFERFQSMIDGFDQMPSIQFINTDLLDDEKEVKTDSRCKYVITYGQSESPSRNCQNYIRLDSWSSNFDDFRITAYSIVKEEKTSVHSQDSKVDPQSLVNALERFGLTRSPDNLPLAEEGEQYVQRGSNAFKMCLAVCAFFCYFYIVILTYVLLNPMPLNQDDKIIFE